MKYLVCGATKERRAYSLMEAKSLAKQMLKGEYFPYISEGADIYDEEGNRFNVSCDFLTDFEILELAQRDLNLDFIFYNFPTTSVATWIEVLYEVSDLLACIDHSIFDAKTGRIRGSVVVDRKTFTFYCDGVSVVNYDYKFSSPICVKRGIR